MARLQFGTFLAPHHPLGEHPTLQFQRDIELAAHLDRLGFDEFWVGEHHSSGWEMIASPEMFLAAAGMATHHIRLGTGVISLPYHHPFNVAQRMVQLDHMTRGRAMFGSGPGALPSDAHTLGISPMVQRDRQDEALGVIIRLLNGEERFSYDSEWFTLRDAALQLLPLQERMPMATASSISPSGMQLAGKHGTGVLSIASTSTEGIAAPPRSGVSPGGRRTARQGVDRADWRVMMSWHIAETKEQARKRPSTVCTAGTTSTTCACSAVRERRGWRTGGSCSTRWPRAVPVAAALRSSAPRRPRRGDPQPPRRHRGLRRGARLRPRLGQLREHEAFVDLVARYVVPELNGYFRGLQASADFLHERQGELMAGASAAVMSKIMSHEGAAQAMATPWPTCRRPAPRARATPRSGPVRVWPTPTRIPSPLTTGADVPDAAPSARPNRTKSTGAQLARRRPRLPTTTATTVTR
ncbi:MAG: LLM class flavin-dependent oxidoreductase [Ilumatobacteraceae bacterium]